MHANIYQVVAPVSIQDKENRAILPGRYSVAMFIKSDRYKSVYPFDKFITPENPSRYENLTALQLHKKRVAQLYDAVAY
ncbi:hypothetical protein DPV78_003637 [Talaromyces pinophilus]|nr:hypothetical protein DPV78_003637 [Talaromyces pinophilus]